MPENPADPQALRVSIFIETSLFSISWEMQQPGQTAGSADRQEEHKNCRCGCKAGQALVSRDTAHRCSPTGGKVMPGVGAA